MLPTQLDMPAARYAFTFLAIGGICQKQEEFISYRIDAERQYIDRRKIRARIEGFVSFYSCSFLFVYGFGLFPFAFERSNVMLAINGIF